MTREEALRKAINIVACFEAHFAKSKEAREEGANIIEALEQEPKTGKWIKEPNCYYRCSECGEHYPSMRGYMEYKYCPNCGAKMKEGD